MSRPNLLEIDRLWTGRILGRDCGIRALDQVLDEVGSTRPRCAAAGRRRRRRPRRRRTPATGSGSDRG
jgi:hypothetical protein